MTVEQAIARARARIADAYRYRLRQLEKDSMPARALQVMLDQQLMGHSVYAASRVVGKALGITRREAEAFVWPESGRAQSLAKLWHLQDQGVERYEWLTAGGDCCDTCAEMARRGPYSTSTPPHPLPAWNSCPTCRCCIVPVLPD